MWEIEAEEGKELVARSSEKARWIFKQIYGHNSWSLCGRLGKRYQLKEPELVQKGMEEMARVKRKWHGKLGYCRAM